MRVRRPLIALVLLCAVCAPLGASDWEYDLAPYYFWGTSIKGQVAARGADVPVDLAFGDVAENLKFIFTLHFEARDRDSGWGLFIDPMYVNLGAPIDGDKVNGEVGMEMLIGEVMAIKRWGDDEMWTDSIFGLRYTGMDMEVDPAALPTTASQKEEWLDFVVGLRVGGKFSENWNGVLRLDVGGFGLSGSSDFAWSGVALFRYQFARHASFGFGYKHLDQNYEDGSGTDYFKFDAYLTGPVLGFDFNW